jgi:hypothetical protein
MTVEELALGASVVFSGLWSGLLGTLTTILHPMLAAMDDRDFRNFMGAFLGHARKAWFNYVCALGMAIAPIVALVACGASGAPLRSCSPRSAWSW